jgi:hypothetical protein
VKDRMDFDEDSDLDGNAAEESTTVCFLCVDPINDSIKLYKGVSLHTHCHSAVRCHDRLLAKAPARLAAHDALMHTDPLAWREPIEPLIDHGASHVRDKSHYMQLKERYSEEIKDDYTRDEVIEDQLGYTLKAWLARERDEDEAVLTEKLLKEEFLSTLKAQHRDPMKRPKNAAGEFLLLRASTGPVKVRKATGTAVTSRRVKRRRESLPAGSDSRVPQPSSSPIRQPARTAASHSDDDTGARAQMEAVRGHSSRFAAAAAAAHSVESSATATHQAPEDTRSAASVNKQRKPALTPVDKSGTLSALDFLRIKDF